MNRSRTLSAGLLCGSAVLTVVLAGAVVRAAEGHGAARAAAELAAADFVAPAVQALADATSALPQAVERVCRTGDDGAREDLQSAFRETVAAWASVSIVRFETSEAQAIIARIRPQGALGGQPNAAIAAVLTRADGAVLLADAFAKLPPAAQGLSGLDAVLADARVPLRPAADAAFRCAYATAVAGQLAHASADLARRDSLAAPRTSDVLLAGMVDALQSIHADVARASTRSAYVAPSMTRTHYAARIAATERLYDVMAIEALLPEAKDWVKNRAYTAWRTLEASDRAGGRGDAASKHEVPKLPDTQTVLAELTVLQKLLVDEVAVTFAPPAGAKSRAKNAARDR